MSDRSYSVDPELMHYQKGQRASKHKYITIKNGRYIYNTKAGSERRRTNANRAGTLSRKIEKKVESSKDKKRTKNAIRDNHYWEIKDKHNKWAYNPGSDALNEENDRIAKEWGNKAPSWLFKLDPYTHETVTDKEYNERSLKKHHELVNKQKNKDQANRIRKNIKKKKIVRTAKSYAAKGKKAIIKVIKK